MASRRTSSVRIPKYRKQTKRGGPDLAFVELQGRRVYLGPYDSAESTARYHQVLAEFDANGGELPIPHDEITIMEVAARFWTHVEAYYRKPDGTATSEQANFRQVLKPLKRLFDRTAVVDFGPRRLRAARHEMARMGWSRTHINKQVSRLRRVIKWAAEQELVDARVWQNLQAVAPLKRGRCDAREAVPVRPVPEAIRKYRVAERRDRADRKQYRRATRRRSHR
ncbi:MAG: hypothetical protein IID42_10220 [Planctomycetes bacterium]|nr:hypothetical protein [Planctomycetota bacterium]